MAIKDSGFSQQEVFDRMAPGWYSRRHWTIFRTELEDLAKRWQGGRLLNVGCGHGADFLPFRAGFDLHGVDFSAGMLEHARKYAKKFSLDAKLVQASAAKLPYGKGTFDRAIAVATYHHLRTEEERLAALTDLRRVLRPGGEAFITVWNRWQPAFWLKKGDTLIRWRTKEADLYRYYHLFSPGELRRLVLHTGFSVVRSSCGSGNRFPAKLFGKNVCLLIRKP